MKPTKEEMLNRVSAHLKHCKIATRAIYYGRDTWLRVSSGSC
jgi:hypothetical protein